MTNEEIMKLAYAAGWEQGSQFDDCGDCSRFDVVKFARMVAEVGCKRVDAEQMAEPVAWRPDVCPITGLPFFMWIEHHETGQMVPTYGGPYDSYTIPVRHEDGSYCRERYDHDNGWWVADEIDDVGVKIVSDQDFVCDDRLPQPSQQPLTEQQDEPSERPFSGLPLVIAGAIFDFAGFLTTRPNTIKVGSTNNASPMADLVKEWAELRGLSLADAAVLSWQELLHTHPQPAQQPLSSARIDELIEEGVFGCNPYELVRRLEEERGVFKTRPLTDEQILEKVAYATRAERSMFLRFARAIENANGIK